MVVSGPDPARRVLRDQLAARLQEPSLASERLLPVAEGLAELLPRGGLRRGSVTVVAGSYALALALVVEASSTGSWVAVLGIGDLGILAGHELGLALFSAHGGVLPAHTIVVERTILRSSRSGLHVRNARLALERLALIPSPGRRWADV